MKSHNIVNVTNKTLRIHCVYVHKRNLPFQYDCNHRSFSEHVALFDAFCTYNDLLFYVHRFAHSFHLYRGLFFYDLTQENTFYSCCLHFLAEP